MGNEKSTALLRFEIEHLEKIVGNIINELSTLNIPPAKRDVLHTRLQDCKKMFENASDESGYKKMKEEVEAIEMSFTLAAIEQAESEIPKTAKTASAFLALEDIKKDVTSKAMTCHKARHEIKEIIRGNRY